jgi:phage host-nuclease inhibitor protein Gam
VTAKSGVPQNRDELNEALGNYFSVKRRLAAVKSRLEERIKKLKEQYAPRIKPLADDEKALHDAIQTHCEGHRAEYTADGIKSEMLPNGTIGWRLGNWTHRIATSEDGVIAELERLGLVDRYVVRRPTLNIELLIRDRDELPKIEGLEIFREERFYIAPPKAKKA